ncbi:MAG: double-strand break repair helicase AddA [Maritimibacter sp.]
MTLNDATLNQIAAAKPDANTWLSANAGSGKTRVLTDRVARLLLDGVSPQNILCLTYTKAAASEMQNRLFDRLGAWAMKPDEALRLELTELGVTEVADLREARRLFAGAIETPGGLKIQTIHSFCSSILRRFPLEAGVSPDFTEMDDRAALMLQMEVIEDMAGDARRPLMEDVARYFTGIDFEDFTKQIVAKRAAFDQPITKKEIWAWFDFADDEDQTILPSLAFSPDAKDTIRKVIPVLEKHSKTMVKRAEFLSKINLDAPGINDFALLKSALLTVAGAIPKTNFLTGACEAEMGELADRLRGLAEQTVDLVDVERRLLTAAQTYALHAFGHAFLRDYNTRKQDRGWLDFDDFITRAGALLNDADVTAWVLYRLDGGIDHILVDEAQDTSPGQWRVIESLAREFMTGEGARAGTKRTIFVVGDPKQSIYSFQGADPAEFSRMKTLFRTGLEEARDALFERSLEYSFRSSKAILNLVDTTFDSTPGLGNGFKHKAFFEDLPGRVDLWPLIEANKDPEPAAWFDPVDMLAPQDEKVQVAERIAEEIERLLAEGSLPTNKGDFRQVSPGDILILVQTRSQIFHEIIRACKKRDLPIAGADKLRIGGELAVKDITSLLRFLATPEDDLSLATVLKSPLFGWDEDRLYRLAHGRGKTYLWNALRADETSNELELRVLNDLRGEADFYRPYDLIERLLTRHDGRRRLTARLGAEAIDGIDTLLQQALAYERIEVPSLTGFLTWLEVKDIEVKRDLGSKGNQIRVMTVHGSKGLEAPIVILPETTKRRQRSADKLIDLEEGKTVWAPSKANMPSVLLPVLADKEERAAEERNRLLYVAMTRAENWLIVAGAGDAGKSPQESWYATIKSGMEQVGALKFLQSGEGVGLRLQTGEWLAANTADKGAVSASEVEVPRWLRTPAKPPVKSTPPLVPSELGGAKVVVSDAPTLSGEEAKQRGRQIHQLLEFLPTYPEEEWRNISRELLASGEDSVNEDRADALFEHARRVLTNPSLIHLFSADALAEVEVSAPVDALGATRIHGVIDRLIVTPEAVLAVDFKTNQIVPERPEVIPEGILRQLGAYEEALKALYPERKIQSAVLWTQTATLMTLPHGLATGTFRRLDGDAAHT